MNEKIPVTNNTKMPIYVAGSMIPAGETRHFDAHQVPPEFRPAAPVAESHPVDSIAELLKGSVAAITAQFGTLSDQDLDRLEMLEAERTPPRKTLIEAISIERLTRAAALEEKKEAATGEGEHPLTGEGDKAPEGSEGSEA